MTGFKLRLGVTALALVMCNCASWRPVLYEAPPQAAMSSYPAAHKAATDLVTKYRDRINATSSWLIAQHVAEALIGAGAATAVFGGEPVEVVGEEPMEAGVWNDPNVGGAAALIGLIFRIAVDEGEMERQRETYARGLPRWNAR